VNTILPLKYFVFCIEDLHMKIVSSTKCNKLTIIVKVIIIM